jgi:hypothetical protein
MPNGGQPHFAGQRFRLVLARIVDEDELVDKARRHARDGGAKRLRRVVGGKDHDNLLPDQQDGRPSRIKRVASRFFMVALIKSRTIRAPRSPR